MWGFAFLLCGVVAAEDHVFGVNLGGWMVIEGWLFPDWTDSQGASWRSYGQEHESTGCLASCQNTGAETDKPKTYTDSVVTRDLLFAMGSTKVAEVFETHYANFLGVDFQRVDQTLELGAQVKNSTDTIMRSCCCSLFFSHSFSFSLSSLSCLDM